MSHEHPFYGQEISRHQQEEYIQSLLSPYLGKPATEEIQKEVYDTLMLAKHRGEVVIPFKVLLKKDETGYYPPHIEVLLDTRV